MSSTNKLLQEAIADAKTVKETALANARLSLEEMFKPQIENMINKQLSESDEDEEAIEDPKSTTDDEPLSTEPANTNGSNDDTVDNIDVTKDDDTLNIDLADDGINTINIELNEPEKPTEECDTSITESDNIKDDFDSIQLDDVDESVEDDDDYIDIDLEGIDLDDLNTNEASMSPLAKKIDDIDIEAYLDANENVDESEDDDIDIDLNDLDINENVSEDERSIVCDKDSKKIKKLEDDLNEAYNVIKIMRKELSESTLTNAKLMYANKLFSKYNLTNEQKLKVLDKFDQAKTIKETKLVYGTLSESLAMVGTQTQRTIKESFASKHIGSTKPKQTIVESAEDAQRKYLMKLAGIN